MFQTTLIAKVSSYMHTLIVASYPCHIARCCQVVHLQYEGHVMSQCCESLLSWQVMQIAQRKWTVRQKVQGGVIRLNFYLGVYTIIAM